MGDRYEEHLLGILSAMIKFADDPALVTGIIDPGDTARLRHVNSGRPLSDDGRQCGSDGRGKWQRLSQLGEEALGLGGIVDHWLLVPSLGGLSGRPIRPDQRREIRLVNARASGVETAFPVL